jgi:hypothetical protein
MQIEVVQERSVTFKLSDNSENDASRIFASIIAKCTAESKKKGFKNMFNEDEKEFLKKFNEQVQFDEA